MARRDTGSFAFDDTVGVIGGDVAETYFQLGLKYASGREVACDFVEAHKWFNLAAMRGHSQARFNRGELASEMSRREISAAQARARAFLRA